MYIHIYIYMYMYIHICIYIHIYIYIYIFSPKSYSTAYKASLRAGAVPDSSSGHRNLGAAPQQDIGSLSSYQISVSRAAEGRNTQYLGASINQGHWFRPQCLMMLILGTPKQGLALLEVSSSNLIEEYILILVTRTPKQGFLTPSSKNLSSKLIPRRSLGDGMLAFAQKDPQSPGRIQQTDIHLQGLLCDRSYLAYGKS